MTTVDARVEEVPAADAGGRPQGWLLAHLAILGAGFAFLLWFAHDNWFVYDEWWMVVDRDVSVDGLLRPHNEHLSTLVVLTHRFWFSLFGVTTYVPYLAGLLAVHVLNAHLLWRLLRRMEVPDAVALALSTVFLFLGAGYSNIVSAFQIVFITPIAICFGSLLLYSRRDYPRRRLVPLDGAVTGLLVFGIFTQTLTLSVILAVAGYLVLSRRYRAAALITVVPVAIYGWWYVAYADDRPPGELSAAEGLRKAPQFVWDGITGGFGEVVGLRVVGIAVVVALAVFVVTRMRWREQRWQLALCPAAAAVSFMGAVALGRAHVPGVATASRYVYVVVALLLPLCGLALGALYERLPSREVVLAVVTILVLVVEVQILVDGATPLLETADRQRGRVVASYELMRDGRQPLDTDWSQLEVAPLSADQVRELGEGGKLPLGTTDENDRLNALGFVAVGIGPDARLPAPASIPAVTSLEYADAAPLGDGCLTVTPRQGDSRIGVRFDAPADVLIHRDDASGARVYLGPRDRDVVKREVQLPEGSSYLSADLEGEYVYLEVASVEPFELCGLTGP